jgi:cytochrome c biogenesis protein CcdA
MLTTLFAFFSGVATVASPCVLPVLPFVLSGVVGGRLRPYGIILGFMASFTVVTLFLSAIVTALNIPPDTLRHIAIVLLLGFGLVLVVPTLHKGFQGLTSRSLRGMQPVQGDGFWGGTAVGATLGVLWMPCVGPIMAGVITLALSGSVTGQAALVTLAYSLGISITMLAVMLGGRKLLGRIPGLMNNLSGIQRGFGVVMVLFAVGFFFGLDRSLQAWLFATFPGYADLRP